MLSIVTCVTVVFLTACTKINELGNLIEEPTECPISSQPTEDGLTVGSIVGITFSVVISIIVTIIGLVIVWHKCQHHYEEIHDPSHKERLIIILMNLFVFYFLMHTDLWISQKVCVTNVST